MTHNPEQPPVNRQPGRPNLGLALSRTIGAPEQTALSRYHDAADETQKAQILNTAIVRRDPVSGIALPESVVDVMGLVVHEETTAPSYRPESITTLTGTNLGILLTGLHFGDHREISDPQERRMELINQATGADKKEARPLPEDAPERVLRQHLFEDLAERAALSSSDPEAEREAFAALSELTPEALLELSEDHPHTYDSLLHTGRTLGFDRLFTRVERLRSQLESSTPSPLEDAEPAKTSEEN